MFKYSNPLYDQFAVELNFQLKSPEADNKINPNLIYGYDAGKVKFRF
jgi:hypothetical protein